MHSTQNLSQSNAFSKSKSSTEKSQQSSCNESGPDCGRQTIDTEQSSGQFAWFELYHLLLKNESLQQLLIDNLNHLFISKQRFNQIKNKNPVFEDLVNRYQSRNCLKAISAARNLSSVKINQYKFLYGGFSLGTAIKLVIRESGYLYRSLLKRDNPMKELRRLVSNWMSYLFVIHVVPEKDRNHLKQVVMESIELTIKLAPKSDEPFE